METGDLLLRLDAAGFALSKAFLSLIWQSCLLFAAVIVISFLLRKKRAALRHLLWTGAVFALPLLPLFSHLTASIRAPGAEIAVIPAYTPPAADYAPVSSSPLEAPAVPAPTPRHGAVRSSRPLTITDYPWAFVFLGYALGAGAFIAVLGLGLFRLNRWRARGRAITDAQIRSICDETSYKIQLPKPAAVLECSGLPAPLTTGVLHPAVLLPENFAGGLSEPELRAVAAHELAHIRRRDPLTLALVSLVRAVFFFHPLVWYTSREIANLAEEACDDQVIDTGHDPVSYASLLYRLAVALRKPPLTTEFAAGFVFSQSAFLNRVKAILAGKDRPLRKVTRRTIAGIILASSVSLAGSIALPLGEKAAAPKETDTTIAGKLETVSAPVQVAQVNSAPAAPDTTKNTPAGNTLSGTVIANGMPVAGAEVYCTTIRSESVAPKLKAKTDDRGAFSFPLAPEDLPESKNIPLNVFAFHPLYAIGWQAVQSDAVGNPLSISLGNPSTISGTVTDVSSKPIPDAEVRITAIMTNGSPFARGSSLVLGGTTPLCGSKVASDGAFIMTNLPENSRVTLHIVAPGYAAPRLTMTTAGSTGIRVVLEAEGRIEGKVAYGPTGKPAAGIAVAAQGIRGRSGWASAKTDDTGQYTLTGLSGGYYNVFIMDSLPEWTAVAQENISVAAGETVTGKDLVLVKGGIITGRVIDQDTGKPIHPGEGSDVALYGPSRPRVGAAVEIAHINSDGSYAIRVASGENYIYLRPTPPWMRENIIVKDHTLLVQEGETVTGRDFVVSKGGKSGTPGGNMLQGRVLDPGGKPAAGVEIDWLPSYQRGIVRSAQSGADGRFIIPLTEIRDITIRALDRKNMLKGIVNLSYQSGDSVEIRLDPCRITSITGRVLDTEGNPVSGATIMLGDKLIRRSMTATVTGEAGTYTLPGLIVGDEYFIDVVQEKENIRSRTVGFIPEENMPPLGDIVLSVANQRNVQFR